MGTISQREAYGKTLVRLGKENERIVVLDADLCKSTMGILFEEAFPKRHFEMGIAEQNMASFAAGLSLAGKIPFINSFAVFVTGRAYDQIRQSICIGSLNVKIAGSSYGLSDFGDGATHQSVEDIAIMRAIPNMTVLAPADATETIKMVEAAVGYNGPVYLRLNRNPLPDIYDEGYGFKIGMPSMVRDGTDIAIFAHGILVFEALEAARCMEDEGISVRVVNVSSLKPVDEKEIKRFCEGIKGIVTAEEHSIIGGLGDIVSAIMKGSSLPMETIGILDQFGQSAQSYCELLEHYGLTSKELIEAVRRLMRWK
jgi:transketolase